MFTDGPERDVAGQDEVPVALIVGESGHVERSGAEELRPGLGHPRRGVAQALLGQIHSQRGQEDRSPAFGTGQIDIAIMDDMQPGSRAC